MSHATLHGNNVSVFSVWIIPGINFCCQVSWHCAQPREHFLFLLPSMPVAITSEKAIRQSVPLLWPWIPGGAKQRHQTFRWQHLFLHLQILNAFEALSSSLSKHSSGCLLLPLCSVSRWHSVPWAQEQACVIRENPGECQTLQGPAACSRRWHFPSSDGSIDILPERLRKVLKYSRMSTPRWLGS